MKVNLKLFLTIFSILFLLSSCSYKEGTFEVKADDVFSLDIPNYLSSSRQLAPGAPIQFQNRFRTIYAVGLYDSKGEARTLDDYDNRVIERFSLDLKDFESNLLRQNTEGGIHKRYYRLTGNTTGENIEYLLMTAEDEQYYYQVCVWTLDFRMEKYEQDLENIIASFERL